MTRWRPQVRPLHRPLELTIRKGHPTGDGTRLESGRAMSLAGSTPAPSAPARAGGFDDLFDGVRGVTAAREPVELEATGSTPAGHPHRNLAEATMTRNVLELPTLVLNRNWQPIHVTTVVRALVMLWNETAKVVEPDEYRLYDWEEWVGARARARPPVHPVGTAAAPGPRGDLPGALRPAARRGGDVQPAQRGQARPPHLPVLRGAARLGGDHRSTTSCRARRGAPRAGPTAWPPAIRATPARPTAPRSRPACTCGAGRSRPEWKPLYAAHGRPGRELVPVPAARAGPAARPDRQPQRPGIDGRGHSQGRAPGRATSLQNSRTGFESLRPAPADVAER